MKTCKDCKFHIKHDETIGFCWRYPPQVVSAEQSAMPPVTSAKTWCGEFRKRRHMLRSLYWASGNIQ